MKKKLAIFSTLLLAAGIFLVIYSYNKDYSHKAQALIAKNGLAQAYAGRLAAVYLIANVNTSCRTCFRYEEMKNYRNIAVSFMVPDDYSDIDMNNFREAFQVSPTHRIERISPAWKNVFTACNPEQTPLNILILLNPDGHIHQLRRF